MAAPIITLVVSSIICFIHSVDRLARGMNRQYLGYFYYLPLLSAWGMCLPYSTQTRPLSFARRSALSTTMKSTICCISHPFLTGRIRSSQRVWQSFLRWVRFPAWRSSWVVSLLLNLLRCLGSVVGADRHYGGSWPCQLSIISGRWSAFGRLYSRNSCRLSTVPWHLVWYHDTTAAQYTGANCKQSVLPLCSHWLQYCGPGLRYVLWGRVCWFPNIILPWDHSSQWFRPLSLFLITSPVMVLKVAIAQDGRANHRRTFAAVPQVLQPSRFIRWSFWLFSICR